MWDKNLGKKKALVLTRAFLIFGGSGVRRTDILYRPTQYYKFNIIIILIKYLSDAVGYSRLKSTTLCGF